MSQVHCRDRMAQYESFGLHLISLGAARFGIAILLVATALLKTFILVDPSIVQSAHELPTWVTLASVQLELSEAFLLLSGWKSHLSWLAALVLFAGFASFALYRALRGYESCGCFGPLEVSPWWTAALDSGVVSLLVIGRRAFRSERFCGIGVVYGAASYALVGGLSLLIMIGSLPIPLPREVGGDERFVILRPADWLGKQFPLSDHVSPRIDVARGDSIVLLYHHDCPKCQNALPQYERFASKLSEEGNSTRVVLVEIPPYGEQRASDGVALHTRLSADRQWFVQAPVEIQIRDGKVKRASLELPSISTISSH